MDCLDFQQQTPFDDAYPPHPQETGPLAAGDRTEDGGANVASDQYNPPYLVQALAQGESVPNTTSMSVNLIPFATWDPTTATMSHSVWPDPSTASMTSIPSNPSNNTNITHAAPVPRASATAVPRARPAYVDLNATRVSPAGPVPHPDPNFHPVGPNNWTEILHDYRLLQYLSNSNIKEIRHHVAQLAEQAPRDDDHNDDHDDDDHDDDIIHPNTGSGGRWVAEDLTAVWRYCDAYLKRRGQLRNNDAARRSRARKDAEIRHWRLVALAAGAEDRAFEYDGADPAYRDEGGSQDGQLLDQEGREIVAVARVTADAIRVTRANQQRGVSMGVHGEQFGFRAVQVQPGHGLPLYGTGASFQPRVAVSSSMVVPQQQQGREIGRRGSPIVTRSHVQNRVKRRRTATPQESTPGPMPLATTGLGLTDAGLVLPQTYNPSHPVQNVDGGGQDDTTQAMLASGWSMQRFC